MSNKENETIKKIQELVPEIMEIKEGAFAFEKNTHERFTFDGRNWVSDRNYNVKKSIQYFEGKIIGRDITLEDVMIAVSKKQGEWSIRFWGNGVIRIAENIDWKSNKPFQDQSQECKDFIGDLILNK